MIGAVSLIIAGCIATTKTVTKPVYYEHAQYGLVSTDHEAFVQDRVECGNRVFANGITIKGQLITNRSKAIELYVNDLVNLNFSTSDFATAGIYGALAVSSGDPSWGTRSSSTSQTFRRPDYADKFNQLENETWDCVATKGWQKRD